MALLLAKINGLLAKINGLSAKINERYGGAKTFMRKSGQVASSDSAALMDDMHVWG